MTQNGLVREWVVASGIIEGPDGVLLVQNRRRNGRVDWSPPGGVIEVAGGESIRDGLTREVEEETGLHVAEWDGPLYDVRAEAAGLGWNLHVEVFRAVSYVGELRIDDPDGIVVDAGWFTADGCADTLAGTWVPTHEPLLAWLDERWTDARSYRYRIDGEQAHAITIIRL